MSPVISPAISMPSYLCHPIGHVDEEGPALQLHGSPLAPLQQRGQGDLAEGGVRGVAPVDGRLCVVAHQAPVGVVGVPLRRARVRAPLVALRHRDRVEHLRGEGEGLLEVMGVHQAHLLHAAAHHVRPQEPLLWVEVARHRHRLPGQAPLPLVVRHVGEVEVEGGLVGGDAVPADAVVAVQVHILHPAHQLDHQRGARGVAHDEVLRQGVRSPDGDGGQALLQVVHALVVLHRVEAEQAREHVGLVGALLLVLRFVQRQQRAGEAALVEGVREEGGEAVVLVPEPVGRDAQSAELGRPEGQRGVVDLLLLVEEGGRCGPGGDGPVAHQAQVQCACGEPEVREVHVQVCAGLRGAQETAEEEDGAHRQIL
mmetsp:Transcript_27049/g.60576  ORF Transcript_27049/g.60576 Transcript_27049/m.60576 type:complete len:369 (+) Transcript_27049:359-1465(+)